MDLSKLPKMGGAPGRRDGDAAPNASSEVSSDEIAGTTPIRTADASPRYQGSPPPSREVAASDLLSELVIAGILGAIFIMLGAHFGGWLLHGGVYETDVTWQSGPSMGMPVKYFELEGGTAWLEMGEWVLGVCLLLEAAICGIGFMTGRFGKKLGTLCLSLGAVGAAANLLAIVMQIQAGFTQPIFSMLALAVGAMTALIHGRRILT